MITSLADPPAPTMGPRKTHFQDRAPSFLETAKHPTICLLHLGLKVLCFLIFTFGSFLFGGWAGDYVFTFVVTTVLLSVDFWVVKNLSGRSVIHTYIIFTGRLLVGMRWYNEVLEDGTNEWKYERATDEQIINATDKMVFWIGLMVWPVIWSTLTFFYVIQLRLDWMLVTIIGCILSGANLIGFWKCSFGKKCKFISIRTRRIET